MNLLVLNNIIIFYNMKIKIFSLTLILLLSANFLNAQTGSEKKSPVGSWKYEASMAPEGYRSGIINVGYTDKKYSVTVAFSQDYKVTADQVRFENNALSGTVYVEGENVKISLKLESGNKMTGTADYSQGQIPLTLTRIPAEKK